MTVRQLVARASKLVFALRNSTRDVLVTTVMRGRLV